MGWPWVRLAAHVSWHMHMSPTRVAYSTVTCSLVDTNLQNEHLHTLGYFTSSLASSCIIVSLNHVVSRQQILTLALHPNIYYTKGLFFHINIYVNDRHICCKQIKWLTFSRAALSRVVSMTVQHPRFDNLCVLLDSIPGSSNLTDLSGLQPHADF